MKDTRDLALRLTSIFNFIKTSAESNQSECEKFCWDLIPMAELGYEIAYEIWKEKEENAPFVTTAYSENKKSDAEILAEKISYLMKSDDVPSPISGGLVTIMNDFFNEHIDQQEFEDDLSPEYVARLLKSSAFFNTDGERTEDE